MFLLLFCCRLCYFVFRFLFIRNRSVNSWRIFGVFVDKAKSKNKCEISLRKKFKNRVKIFISYELNLIFNDFDKFVGNFDVVIGHFNVKKVRLLITFQNWSTWMKFAENSCLCDKYNSSSIILDLDFTLAQSWNYFGLCFRYIIHLLMLMFLVHVRKVLWVSLFLHWQLIVTWTFVVIENQFTITFSREFHQNALLFNINVIERWTKINIH